MDKNTLTVRLASQKDIPEIIRLVKGSFDSALVDATIYGCSGISRYIARNISMPDMSDTLYVVMEYQRRVSGFVEFRIIKDVVFLNYICVDRNLRGKGFGGLILRHALKLVPINGVKNIELDVFSANKLAVSWYKKLGFTQVAISEWWSIPLPKTKPGVALRVSGLPQSELCYEKFGFSQFSVFTGKGCLTIGKLGKKWFRATQREVISNSDVFRWLGELDPKRRVLGLFPSDSGSCFPSGARRVIKSIRLQASIPALLKRLPKDLIC